MSAKSYSVIVVPSDHSGTYQYRISRFLLVTLIALGVLFLVTSLVFAVTWVQILSDAMRGQDELTREAIAAASEARAAMEETLDDVAILVEDIGRDTISKRAEAESLELEVEELRHIISMNEDQLEAYKRFMNRRDLSDLLRDVAFAVVVGLLTNVLGALLLRNRLRKSQFVDAAESRRIRSAVDREGRS